MRRMGLATRTVVVLVAVFIMSTPPVGAQPDENPLPYATVSATTPWVAPDGDWRVELTLEREPPSGTHLRYAIHQPLPAKGLRDRIQESVSGGNLGPSLHNAVSLPLDQLRNGPTVSLTVAIRSKTGADDRALLPNAGIHPVAVELLGAGDAVLFRQVLFLTRLPETTEAPPLRVAPVLQIQVPPIVEPDWTATLHPEAIHAIDSAAEVLEAHRSVPVSLVIDPQLFGTAAFLEDPGATAAIARLSAAVAERPVLRSPWVPVDLASVVSSGGDATLNASLASAQQATAHELGQTPEIETWPIDPTIGPETLDLLRSLDVEHMLVRADQLVADSPDPLELAGRKIHLGSVNSGIDALVVDPRVQARIGDPRSTPALATHLAVTELAGIWFSLPKGVTGASVIDLSGIDDAVATELLGILEQSTGRLFTPSTMRAATADATAATTTVRRRREPVVRQLVRRDDSGVGPIAAELIRLRRRAASYHSTMQDPPTTAPLEQLLLTVQHRDMDASRQLHSLAAAGRRIDDDLARLVPPPTRTYTMTARTAKLPLRITNNNDRPTTVLVRFIGRRLEVNGGRALRIVLQPGSNSFRVPVLVRTSGDFTTRMEIRTADDRISIAETDIRVRSTAFSGIGVLLGGGALVFLVIWWAITIRRDRRARHAEPPGETTAA